jgi:hypothetical protein
MFACTFNSSYIDLGKSQFMNYQGTGLSQFLAFFPIMGLPALLLLALTWLGAEDYYYYAIALLG